MKDCSRRTLMQPFVATEYLCQSVPIPCTHARRVADRPTPRPQRDPLVRERQRLRLGRCPCTPAPARRSLWRRGCTSSLHATSSERLRKARDRNAANSSRSTPYWRRASNSVTSCDSCNLTTAFVNVAPNSSRRIVGVVRPPAGAKPEPLSSRLPAFTVSTTRWSASPSSFSRIAVASQLDLKRFETSLILSSTCSTETASQFLYSKYALNISSGKEERGGELVAPAFFGRIFVVADGGRPARDVAQLVQQRVAPQRTELVSRVEHDHRCQVVLQREAATVPLTDWPVEDRNPQLFDSRAQHPKHSSLRRQLYLIASGIPIKHFAHDRSKLGCLSLPTVRQLRRPVLPKLPRPTVRDLASGRLRGRARVQESGWRSIPRSLRESELRSGRPREDREVGRTELSAQAAWQSWPRLPAWEGLRHRAISAR